MSAVDLAKKYGWKALVVIFVLSGFAGIAERVGLTDISGYLDSLKPPKIEVSSTVVL